MRGLIYKSFLLTVVFCFLISIDISVGSNRGNLSVEQALIGSWRPTRKTWLGFGKDQLSETTLHKFNPNGIYILIEGNSQKYMEYSIREKDEYENSIIIYVKVPETGKGHIKVIKFLPDKTSAKVETHWSYTSVRNKKKNVSTDSTWYFVGQ